MKLYIGNLEWTVTADMLKKHFEPAGVVKNAVIILNRETGRSRGFGFVEMENEEGAEKAKQELDNSLLNNRKLIVREALPEGKGNELPGKISQITKFLNDAQIGEKMTLAAGKKRFVLARDEDNIDFDKGKDQG